MNKPKRTRGKSALIDLFLIALVIFVGYLLYRRGDFNRFLPPEWQNKLATAPATSEPSVTPQSAVAGATPAPAAASPENTTTPESTPAAPTEPSTTTTQSSTPPPADEKLVLTSVDRRYWPHQVKLLRSVEFQAIYNGQTVGSAVAPAGLPVKLIDAKGDQVMVQNGEATKWIAVNDTDVVFRVRAAMKMLAAPTSGTPVPSMQ